MPLWTPPVLEGTWTPAVTFATPGDLSVTYDTQFGRFAKIGRYVWWWMEIDTATFTHGSASGNFRVTGLPDVAAEDGNSFIGAIQTNGIATSTDFLTSLVMPGEQYMELRHNNLATGGIAAITATHVASGGNLIVRASGFYRAAS